MAANINNDGKSKEPTQQQDIVKRFVRSLYVSASFTGEGKTRESRRRRGRGAKKKIDCLDDDPVPPPEPRPDVYNTTTDARADTESPKISDTEDKQCASFSSLHGTAQDSREQDASSRCDDQKDSKDNLNETRNQDHENGNGMKHNEQCCDDERKDRNESLSPGKAPKREVPSIVEQATSMSYKSKQYVQKSSLLLPNSSPNVKSLKCDRIRHLPRTLRWKIQFKLLEVPPSSQDTQSSFTSSDRAVLVDEAAMHGVDKALNENDGGTPKNSEVDPNQSKEDTPSIQQSEQSNEVDPSHLEEIDVMNWSRSLVEQQTSRVRQLMDRHSLALSNAQHLHHERYAGYGRNHECTRAQKDQKESEEKEWEEVKYEEVLLREENNHNQIDEPATDKVFHLTLENAVTDQDMSNHECNDYDTKQFKYGSKVMPLCEGDTQCEDASEESKTMNDDQYCENSDNESQQHVPLPELLEQSHVKVETEKEGEVPKSTFNRENIELLDIILKDLNRLPPRLISWHFDDDGRFLLAETDISCKKDGQPVVQTDLTDEHRSQEQKEQPQDVLRRQHIEWLTIVLFAYAKEHPDIGYRQGMHEILAYTVLALEQDYCRDDVGASSWAEESNTEASTMDGLSPKTPLWRTDVQIDAYLLFEAWMNGLKSAYRDEDTKEEQIGDNLPKKEDKHLFTEDQSSAPLTCNQNHSNNALETREEKGNHLAELEHSIRHDNEKTKELNSNHGNDNSDNASRMNGNICHSPHRNNKSNGLNLGERILQLTSFASSSVYYVLLKVTHDMGVPPELYCAKWLRLLFGREFCKRQHVLEFWDFMLNLLYDPWYILWHTTTLQERVHNTLVARFPLKKEAYEATSVTTTETITSTDCDTDEKTTAITPDQPPKLDKNIHREDAIASARELVGTTLTLMDVIECVACSMILLQRKTLIQNLNTSHQQSIISSSTSTLRSSLRRVGREVQDDGQRQGSKGEDREGKQTQSSVSSSKHLTQSLKMNPFYFFVQDDEDEERAAREGLCLLMNYPTMASPRELMVMSIRVVRFHMEHRLGMIVQASSTYATSALMKQKRGVISTSHSKLSGGKTSDKRKKKKKKKRSSTTTAAATSANSTNIGPAANRGTSYARRFPLVTGV